MTQDELRDKLRYYLEHNPVPLSWIAKSTGIHYITISNFLKGRRKLYTRNWGKLERYLKSTRDNLLQ